MQLCIIQYCKIKFERMFKLFTISPETNFVIICFVVFIIAVGIASYVVLNSKGGIVYKPDYKQFQKIRDQLQILKFTPNFLFTTSENGIITWTNKETLRQLGFSNKELTEQGKNIYSLIRKEFIADVEKLKEEHAEEEDKSSIIVEICRKNNTIIPCELSIGRSEKDEGGISYNFIFKNISHRLKHDQQKSDSINILVHKINNYRSMEKIMQAGYWYLDVFTGLTEISEGMNFIYGVTGDSHPAEKLMDRVDPDDRIMVSDALNKLRESFLPYEITFKVNPMDGFLHTVRSIAKPVLNPKDATQLLGIEGTCLIIKRDKSKWT